MPPSCADAIGAMKTPEIARILASNDTTGFVIGLQMDIVLSLGIAIHLAVTTSHMLAPLLVCQFGEIPKLDGNAGWESGAPNSDPKIANSAGWPVVVLLPEV
jgi:hypothetical protein